MPFGVTTTGFLPKRLSDITASLKARLEAITDSDNNTISIDLEDSSLISQMVNIIGEELSEAWEMGSALSTQFDPRYNTGPFQSGTVQINGIFRRASTPTKLAVTLTGVATTVIPVGSVIATSDNLHTFTLDANYTIGGGGTVTGYATSTETTPVVVANSASMNIQNPIAGWTNVVCASTSVAGTAEETDEELRIRQQRSTQVTAQRETEAILANIINVDGVTFATIYENPDTDVGGGVDAKGIPVGAICAVVEGGTDADVAESIYNRMSCMTLTHGNTTETIELVDIKFERPSDLPIYVAVEVAGKGAGLPAGYADLVKAAILAFVTDSTTGYVPGQSVYASELICSINAITGVVVTAITVSNDDATFASSAAVVWNEIATFDATDIDVTSP